MKDTVLEVEITSLVVWKLSPESRSVVSFHHLQKIFSVDVSTARTFVALVKIQYTDFNF